MNPETLLQWVEMQLGRKKVKMPDRFYEDLAAESIDMLHLVVMVEENTGISIPEEEIADFRTVQDMYDFIIRGQENGNS